ncbi:predicted oxidoreductase [Bacteroidales bacterium 6E]|nr:predicted oxidoreductase [Bacteroidales bacterium 6E]
MSFSVVMIGAGNVATHIAKRLKNQGVRITQVYSRTEETAMTLADSMLSEWTTDPRAIDQQADVYFLALKDSVLVDFLDISGLKDKLLVHCSGSLDISLLARYSSRFGVVYPLQTFSKSREVETGEIPVFIEASDSETEREIFQLAQKISNQINRATSRQRMRLHIAAVFACNFVNHMYALADQIVVSTGFGFEILQPLIQETSEKIRYLHPKDAQTGPAVRNDRNIIESHLDCLRQDGDLSKVYELLSQHIFTFQQK